MTSWRKRPPTPSSAIETSAAHVVERKHGKAGSRRALRACASSRRGRCGHPVLQEPVLAAADGERRNRPGVPGFLLEIPEAFISAAASEQALTRQALVTHQ